ncbi:PAS domain-containing protein [Leptolyngbya sp. NK1-12]|uniref:PAS domain-containing protein n=1 Tax=Leptolyngbya sp. NK1-12 TaxID=2547451 RepID=A0AA97ASQ7_9CYAN|nr:PAS domain-containing protein [Elainella sp. C42_A2020_010]WNZ27483.1 PAS domain-containing protein [Leptolyngbya sp. NK1-12]
MLSTDVFKRQIESMYERLVKLYTSVETSPVEQLIPDTWKELGIAVEELQVANEELNQQNVQIAETLEEATAKHYYYRDLLDHIPEAYLVTTTEGKILEANLMATRLLRVPQSHLVGKLLVNFVPATYRSTFRTALSHLSKGKQPHAWSIWLQPRDSAPAHFAITTSARYSAGSGEIYLNWILREMTETWTAITPNPQEILSFDPTAVEPVSTNLEKLLHQRPQQTYVRGDSIPLHPQVLWQVERGLVKLHTFTEEGEEVLLGLLGASMVFGSGSVFLPAYQVTALTDVQLTQFSLAEVKAFPDLAQQLLPQLNCRIQQMEALLAVAGQRRVKHRLYLLLRFLRQEIGEPVPGGIRLNLRLTHGDLASACCTTRVTITRLIGELQRRGKIRIDSKSYIILDENF